MQRVSWIWYQAIWWSGSSPGDLEYMKYLFIAIASWLSLALSGSTYRCSYLFLFFFHVSQSYCVQIYLDIYPLFSFYQLISLCTNVCLCINLSIFLCSFIKLVNVVEGDRGWPRAPFLIAPKPRVLLLSLDCSTLLLICTIIILTVKEWGIKYHFLSLWYDLTWEWTPVSRAILPNRTMGR